MVKVIPFTFEESSLHSIDDTETYVNYPVIYSDEPRRPPLPHQPVSGDQPGRPRAVNGTIAYLPALVGVMLAGVIIRRLLGDLPA